MSSMGGGSSGGDPSQQQPQRRELTDEDDLFTREFVDDLEEREPLGFGMFSFVYSHFQILQRLT